jgi:hypothetical protein
MSPMTQNRELLGQRAACSVGCLDLGFYRRWSGRANSNPTVSVCHSASAQSLPVRRTNSSTAGVAFVDSSLGYSACLGDRERASWHKHGGQECFVYPTPSQPAALVFDNLLDE